MSLAVEASEGTSMNFERVPVIDLSGINSTDPNVQQKLANEVKDACMQVGFFYVKNHGIPEKVIDNTLQMAKEFFALPLETKMEIENKKQPNFKGYSPLLSGKNNPEGGGDLQEGFEFGWEDPSPTPSSGFQQSQGVMLGANVWPSAIPGFRETVLKYYYAAVKLGKSMFPLFAQALSLPENFFDDKTEHSAALMKLLHYPPQIGLVDDRIIGIGAHTEYNPASPNRTLIIDACFLLKQCFTILWQEPGLQALQVLNSEQKWIDVPPIPGTLVINLGDQFARWTNDIFKSTVHRAINRNVVRRYSIPLFFGTDYNVKLEPISSCVSSERPPKYEVTTAGEYVKSRLHATYHHPSQGPA